MNKEQLNKCFDEASDLHVRLVGVVIDMGLPKNEVIINHRDNFAEKMAYYNLAYDKALEHKHAEGVRIVAFAYGDTFREIETKLGIYLASGTKLN